MKSRILFLAFCLTALGLGAQETHRVESTQTLYSIAKLYDISLQNLMEWNQLTDYQIRPGQVLIVKPTQGSGTQLIRDTYVVRSGDSLSQIAFRYSVSLDDLMKLNQIKEPHNIRVGQRIYIRQPTGVQFYTVQAGDSLSLLTTRFGMTQKDLQAINSLNSEQLRVGQILRVSRPAEKPLTHEVHAIDTLEGIAALYNMNPEKLVQLNSLQGKSVQKGQILKIQDYASGSARIVGPGSQTTSSAKLEVPVKATPTNAPNPLPATAVKVTHTVALGETLYGLSRKYGVTVADIRQWNGIVGDQIKKGQNLTIQTVKVPEVSFPDYDVPQDTLAAKMNTKPAQELNSTESEPVSTPVKYENLTPSLKPQTVPAEDSYEKLTWDAFLILDRDIPLFEWNNDFYYWSHPGQVTQPSRGYYENQWNSPLEAYKKATKIWDSFGNLLDKRPQKSTLLSGYTFVLDPGHGGLDPGAIVKSSDGNGDTLFITEDEYVYDIALRMVPLLREHGAQVELTILAPNHLIRDTTPATKTLINEKNEVYNDMAFNKEDTVQNWVTGGNTGLLKRVQVAEKLFAKYPKNKTIFLSIHADNSPNSPMGTGLFYQSTPKEDSIGKAFAEKLLPFVGSNGYVKSSDLAVLRNNSATHKLLIEIRNVSFQEHSWALRFANTRQGDALKIVRGLLEFVQ